MVDKEEIAATLRKMLGVNVRFEKLSKDELLKLLEAVKRLAESAKGVSEAEGILGLGVLPTIRNEMRRIMPQIRTEVEKLVRKTVDKIFEERGKRAPG